MKFKAILGLSLLSASFFALGWIGSSITERGEHAMAGFMDSYSALAYLYKGDVPNAMLVLRASTEANLLAAEKYGDWKLEAHRPGAMWEWFAQYAKLRGKLPETTRGPVDQEFDSKLDEVLRAAIAKTGSQKK